MTTNPEPLQLDMWELDDFRVMYRPIFEGISEHIEEMNSQYKSRIIIECGHVMRAYKKAKEEYDNTKTYSTCTRIEENDLGNIIQNKNFKIIQTPNCDIAIQDSVVYSELKQPVFAEDIVNGRANKTDCIFICI